MASKVSFFQSESGALNTVPIVDGQLVFTTDTHQLYRDIGTERVLIQGEDGISIILSSSQPNNVKTGDIWLVTE